MSEKTIAQKLQIKPGMRLAFVGEPDGYLEMIGPLPEGAEFISGPGLDMIQFFAQGRKDMESELPKLKTKIKPKGFIWITYHKGTSGVRTDINRDTIFQYALTIGMTPVSQIAINEDWSALRLKIIES